LFFTCTNASQAATCTCNTYPRISPHNVVNHSSHKEATIHWSSNHTWSSQRTRAMATTVLDLSIPRVGPKKPGFFVSRKSCLWSSHGTCRALVFEPGPGLGEYLYRSTPLQSMISINPHQATSTSYLMVQISLNLTLNHTCFHIFLQFQA
jgi:hypothetical protein